VWARGHCRISPPRFLAECCTRQLNQGSSVLLYFRLFTFSDLYCVCLSVFSCTVLFVSISQVIGCKDRLHNDLYCVEWGVKLYHNQPSHYYVVSDCFIFVFLIVVTTCFRNLKGQFHGPSLYLKKLRRTWSVQPKPKVLVSSVLNHLP